MNNCPFDDARPLKIALPLRPFSFSAFDGTEDGLIYVVVATNQDEAAEMLNAELSKNKSGVVADASDMIPIDITRHGVHPLLITYAPIDTLHAHDVK